MKKCSKCGEEKDESEFYNLSKPRHGLMSGCKVCFRSQVAVNRPTEKSKETARQWRIKNAERVNESNTRARKKYIINNKSKVLESRKLHYKTHKQDYRDKSRFREDRIKRSTPLWADKKLINIVYLDARNLTEATGIKHHVDHILPLNGATVSGLHVHYNMQILTEVENLKKANSFTVE